MATVNLHTHTVRCKHAKGTVADYVQAACAQGFHVLGITDHTPFPDNRIAMIRMAFSELPDYIAEVRAAQASCPQLNILLGLECEYFPEFDAFYRSLREEMGMDYLIGSVHGIAYRGGVQGFWNGFRMDAEACQSYADAYVHMLESGHFLFGAHPDLFGAAIADWNQDCEACAERICAAAKRLSVPLEINVSGWTKQQQTANALGYATAALARAAGHSCPRPYPQEDFWRVAAAYGIKVIVNSDAHDPLVLNQFMDLGYAVAQRHGLEVIYPFGQ